MSAPVARRAGRARPIGTAASLARGALVLAALATSACDLGFLGSLLDRRGDPSALWELVSTCVDQPTAEAPAPACSCPAFERSCCGDRDAPTASVLWGESPDFVAIRDLKTCGCPADFVAGLTLPRTRVTGIEDPRRPEAIWPFAWKIARTRISEELEIGLVINPRDARSQNQMHVHLLRLRPGIRAQLDAAAPGRDDPALGGGFVAHLPDLDGVFAVALALAGESAIADRGILVARARDGGFVIVVTTRTSPQAFTVNRCTA